MNSQLSESIHHRSRRLRARLGASLAPTTGPRILAYHRICDDDHPLAVSRDRFRQHLDLLAATCDEVVSVSDLLAGPSAPGRRRVALTFDDGYLDAASIVAPELRARGFGATFFVLPRFDRAPRDLTPDMIWSDRGLHLTLGLIIDLARQGFEVAAHGRQHVQLTTLDDATAWDEVAGSRRELSALLGHPVAGFAYPDGIRGHGHASLVARAGYRWAVTFDSGVVTPATSVLTLPRTVVTAGDDPETLVAILNGGLDRPSLARLRRNRRLGLLRGGPDPRH